MSTLRGAMWPTREEIVARSIVLGIVSTLMASVLPGLALAGTVSGSAKSVQVQVLAACAVTSPPYFAFGIHSSGAAAPGGITHAMSINCVSGTVYHLAFLSSNDLSVTGTAKQMKPVTTGVADTIPYNLRIGGQIIGKLDGVNTYDSIGTGGNQNINVRATITGWTGATGGRLTTGTYVDTVTARVDF